MKAELIQAITKANPDYFSWNQDQREAYGQNIPKDEHKIVKAHLYKELFGITLKPNKNSCDLTDEQKLLYNETILQLTGIGENHFYLNESVGEQGIFDFKTWYNYDLDRHEFQASFNKRDTKDNKDKPYRGTVFNRWTRMLIDGKFYYVTMVTEAGYLFGALDEVVDDYIEELIPCKPAKQKKNSKKTFRLEANGMEDQRTELRSRVNAYMHDRLDHLLEKCFTERRQEVYFVDISKNEFDPHLTIIASDPEVMKLIRFKTIISDCRRYEKSADRLLESAEAERAMLKAFVKREFDDITTNFNKGAQE